MEKEDCLKEIKNKKFFVVEGEGDVQFFKNLLDKIGITDFFAWEIRGKDKFSQELPILFKLPGFSRLTHIAIIRDKESDHAFESVVNILRRIGVTNLPTKNGEVVPGSPSVGIFIMPGEETEGTMLEDLCLKTIEIAPNMKCVNEFAKCISDLEKPPKNLSKSKVLAYLASQPEYVNTIGLAAEKNYWDFNSPALNELVTFLKKFQ